MANPVRILHFSPHNENCGIGKYQENYMAGMEALPNVANEFFEVSPYKLKEMSAAEQVAVMDRLKKELQNFDILHIQHEFSYYWTRETEFRNIVEAAQETGKRLVVTVHTSPAFALKEPKLGGLGPRSLVHHLKELRHYGMFTRNHLEPLRKADLVLTHNKVIAADLVSVGVASEKVKQIVMPVYAVNEPPKSELIATQLHRQKGDVIVGLTGFLHRYKGIMDAVKALKYLPDNYKLALIGGVKADSDDVGIENRIADLIDTLGLRDRVYITGYVQDDNVLNSLIRECDVCLYPYDREYYARVSPASVSLAFANHQPVIGYPTESFKGVAEGADGALVLCETFAYYELARELQRIDLPKQAALSKAYAKKAAWPLMAKELTGIYEEVAGK